jgi:hypothetical protein
MDDDDLESKVEKGDSSAGGAGNSDGSKKSEEDKTYKNQGLSDFFLGVLLGGMGSMMFYQGQSIAMGDAALRSGFVALPYGFVRGYMEGKDIGLKAGAATYAGALAGQFLISLVESYSR